MRIHRDAYVDEGVRDNIDLENPPSYEHELSFMNEDGGHSVRAE